jgi:hypothetical protein
MSAMTAPDVRGIHVGYKKQSARAALTYQGVGVVFHSSRIGGDSPQLIQKIDVNL